MVPGRGLPVRGTMERMPQHRLPIGAWGKVTVSRRGEAWQARTYVRDADGVRRQVRAQAATKAAARQALARALAMQRKRKPDARLCDMAWERFFSFRAA